MEFLKKAFKTQNKHYSNKSDYKNFEDLIPNTFKEKEYEDFIYRLEKACFFKFINKFVSQRNINLEKNMFV